MPTILTQNWLTNLILPIVALAIASLSAFAVWRHRWFSVRPVLSTYTWFLVVTSVFSLIIYFLQVPETFRSTACRVYFLTYYSTLIITCFFSVAVLYEFLFRMADTNKSIQRTAVFGFVITISIITAWTYGLIKITSSATETLAQAARLFNGLTTLALLVSGTVISAIKMRRSLHLEPKLSIVLATLALYSFVDLLVGFVLRRSEQITVILDDLIWITFATLLYWALKNGPAISGAGELPPTA
jgi:hypothetical protein